MLHIMHCSTIRSLKNESHYATIKQGHSFSIEPMFTN